MRVTGAFAPFRIANRDKALILTYHRFSDTGIGNTTSASAFAKQLQYLTTHYRIVPLSTLSSYLTRGKELPDGLVAIAIDDGYRDAYEIAFPILREHNVPATLFVVTDFIDRRTWLWTDKLRFLATVAQFDDLTTTITKHSLNLTPRDYESRLQAAAEINSALKRMPDDVKEQVILRLASSLGIELPDLPPEEYGPITWDQAREMDSAGVELGSHTVTHPILTRVNDERLRIELSDSRSRIEGMLCREVDLFCYPNGDYDERVLRAVQTAGYRWAVTVDPGFNDIDSDPLRLRRVHSENNFARFVQSTSGFEQVKNRVVYPGRKAVAGSYS